MRSAILLLLIAVIASCFADDLSVTLSPSGNDSTCSEDDPCATMQGIADFVAATGDVDSVTVSVEAGTYNGTKNIGVTFPNVSLTVNGDAADTVSFVGNNNNSCVVFPAHSGLLYSFSDLTIENCANGIDYSSSGELSNPDDDEEYDDASLKLSDCYFVNVDNAVKFHGEQLHISDSQFNNSVVAVSISFAFIVDIDESNFYASSSAGIYMTMTSASAIEVDVEDCDFTTSGVVFNVPMNSSNTDQFDGDIEGCNFNDITNTALTFNDNNWSIEEVVVENAKNGAVFIAQNVNASLLVENIEFSGITRTALNFTGSRNGGGTIQIGNDGTSSSISTSAATSTCFYTSNPQNILIQPGDDLFLEHCLNAMTISAKNTNNGNFIFENIQANNTGTANFVLSASTNVTINDWESQNPKQVAFKFTDGYYGIKDVTVSNPQQITSTGGGIVIINKGIYDFEDCEFSGGNIIGSGGAVYITNAVVNFESCTFEDNKATVNGGAICAVNVANNSLSIKDSDFTSNTASQLGGAIYIAGTGTIEAFVEGNDFEDNAAKNGTAVACSSSDITLVVSDPDLADGQNTYQCKTVEGTFTSVATMPSNSVPEISDSSDSDWLFWLILILAILLVVGLIVAGVVGVYFYRKRSQYQQVE